MRDDPRIHWSRAGPGGFKGENDAKSEGFAGEAREFLDDLLVSRPFERHHQLRQPFDFLPAPGNEFRLVTAAGIEDVDFALVAGEAQRVPLLLLAAVFALPR